MTEGALSAGAVARRLGVAVTTLRTWHQRYGLGPSRHAPGQHRRYTTDDLAQLEAMRQLTAAGVPAAEAARWAARQAPNAPPPETVTTPPTSKSRAGGGYAIPVGRASLAARGLARAAMRLDSDAMRKIITRAIEAEGVVSTWDSVVRPVLVGVGERHTISGRLIDVEHLLSRTTSEVLGTVPRPASNGPPARILLACTAEEQHSLPLEALAAALAEADVPCRILGGRVPPAALADAVRRTGPTVLMLWSQAVSTADVDQLHGVLTGASRPLLVLAGGPGWQQTSLPAGVVAPGSLINAVRLATHAAGYSISGGDVVRE